MKCVLTIRGISYLVDGVAADSVRADLQVIETRPIGTTLS